RRKLTFRLRTARDLQRNADLGERPGRARDGSLGQSGAPPQESEPGRIMGAPAGVQDRCPAGIPAPLPGRKLISETPTWGVARDRRPSLCPRLPSVAPAGATMSNSREPL